MKDRIRENINNSVISICPFEDILRAAYHKIGLQEKIAFVSSLLWGIAAHGFMFANKISFHDDMSAMFSLGATLSADRWFLAILYALGRRLSIHVSSSWYNGGLSLLCLAFSAAIVVKVLDIHNKVLAVACAGAMVVFPAMAAIFGYMFMAHTSALAILLMYVAVYFAQKERMKNIIISAALIAASLGIYQGFLGIFTSIALILLIKNLLEGMELGGGNKKIYDLCGECNNRDRIVFAGGQSWQINVKWPQPF